MDTFCLRTFIHIIKKWLTLRHRTYTINQDGKDLLEWEKTICKKSCLVPRRQNKVKKKNKKMTKGGRGDTFWFDSFCCSATCWWNCKTYIYINFRWEKNKKTVRQNILLRRRTTPKRIRLPNGQSFLARYKKVSRWNLPSNVTIRRTRRIGMRNRLVRKAPGQIKNTAAQDRARRIVKKYWNLSKRKQRGGSLLRNIVNWWWWWWGV